MSRCGTALARLAATLCAVLACGAQGDGERRAEAGPSGPLATPALESDVAARVDDEAIREVAVDAPLRLRLHELALRAHRMRRERLQAMIAERVAPGASPEEVAARVREAEAAGRVEIFLEPPQPPRLAVPAGDAPARGPADAGVTLVVFCDFASSHCARFQPILRRLRERYPRDLRVAHRDLPLPFHRHAFEAAVAARCAGAQNSYFGYHDALYTRERLDEEARLDLAQTLGLDLEAFRACVEGRSEPAAAAKVEQDAAIAARLGLPRVPTSFANGRYVPGPASLETLEQVVAEELARAGGAAPPTDTAAGRGEPPLTELPLTLVATVAHEDPRRSSATIESPHFDRPRVFGPGDPVLEDARLERVEPRLVLLRRGDGSTERLPLRGAARDAAPPPAPHLDAEGVLHVARERIDRALEDREALEADLATGRLDLEGKRLLKLQKVEEGNLYDLLGFQEKDVLMQVDGVFVHDSYNPLFEALRTQTSVTVTVMRGGFPKTFEIEID